MLRKSGQTLGKPWEKQVGQFLVKKLGLGAKRCVFLVMRSFEIFWGGVLQTHQVYSSFRV